MWGHSGYLAIARWNGPLGKYTALYDPGDPGIGQPNDGDVLRAEIRGDIIEVYKNGATVAVVNVTALGGDVWKDGQPGMGLWPVDSSDPASLGWKSYAAGSL